MPAEAVCAIAGCERPARKRSLCGTHYQRWWRSGGPNGGDPLGSAPSARPWRGGACLVPDCDRANYALGLCRLHAHRAYRETSWLTPEIKAERDRRRSEHTYCPPDAPDAWPVRELRRELCEQRHQGVPFEAAWPLALALIGPDLDPWRDALDFAKPEWRAAYIGEPPTLSFGIPDPWAPALHLDQAADDLIEFF